MAKRTALYDCHNAAHALMVDFAGWDMPLHYGSQLEEHHIIRRSAGMFDVSHMVVVDVTGATATAFLRYLLANDVAKLTAPGKALYSCLLNEQGGIIDDLIVYRLTDTFYRIVVNAGTAEKDIAWFEKQASAFAVSIKRRSDLSILAIQGPDAMAKTMAVLTPARCIAIASLKPFEAALTEEWLIARTGYTGESGYEVILPSTDIIAFWQALLAVGVAPCGLGARDTCRLEAGLNLYGNDMDESVTPFESNLAWTVALMPVDRDFIGRHALVAQQQAGVKKIMVGLVLAGRGVLRHDQRVVVAGCGEGVITSGTFSPTLQRGIALARVPAGVTHICEVDVRGKLLEAIVIKPPFVKNGQSTISSFIQEVS